MTKDAFDLDTSMFASVHGAMTMGNTDIPFVAVIGGLWELDEAKAAAAKAAGRVIGAELAKAGFGLVVYFSDDESLEPHVVSKDETDAERNARYERIGKASAKTRLKESIRRAF